LLEKQPSLKQEIKKLLLVRLMRARSSPKKLVTKLMCESINQLEREYLKSGLDSRFDQIPDKRNAAIEK
jgi:hypothetical protein